MSIEIIKRKCLLGERGCEKSLSVLHVTQLVSPIGLVESKGSSNDQPNRVYLLNRFAPKPKYQCVPCLIKVGYGYGRIARLFQCKKHNVFHWLKRSGLKIARLDSMAAYYSLKPKPVPKIKPPKPPKPTSEELLQCKTDKKLKMYLRRKVWGFFKHNLYPNAGAELVSCSRPELLAHLKRLFAYGMELSNYGKEWEIDHIKPCRLFNLRNPSERKKCFHFSNLRPMWPSVNRRKAGSYNPHRARSAPKQRASLQAA